MPDSFDAFARSDAARRIRAAADAGRLSHAYLFTGAPARRDAALFAAAAMQCSAPNGKPCFACAHCRKILAGIHPDLISVEDDTHKEIAVQRIRDARTDAFIAPNEGARKIYLFPDAAALSERDQNTLLKIIEEGPPYAAFLFCVENAAEVLDTVRSRCVEVRVAGDAGEGDLADAAALVRVIASGNAADRAEWCAAFERAKQPREALADLLSRTAAVLSAALAARCGAAAGSAVRDAAAPIVSCRLTNQQIVAVIDTLNGCIGDCHYNVSVGPLLGGLAAEWEEIL